MNSRMLVVMSAIVLAACGGGGGGDDEMTVPKGPVSLAAKADVLRELYNVAGVTIDAGITAKSARLLPLVQAKASTREDCADSGSVRYEDNPGSHVFGYFGGVSKNLTIYTDTYSGCREDNLTLNGVIETGTSDGYLFSLIGGDSGYVETYSADGFTSLTAITGLVESLSTEASQDLRTQNFQFAYSETGGYSARAEFGVDEIFVNVTDAAGAQSFDGDYAYVSSDCSGGLVAVATTDPLTYNGGAINGGALAFTSGSASASITFGLDGGATLQLPGGVSATATPAEVSAALSTNPC